MEHQINHALGMIVALIICLANTIVEAQEDEIIRIKAEAVGSAEKLPQSYSDYVNSTPTTTPPQSQGGLSGSWSNVNANTRSITKLEIGIRGDQLVVHAWGKCHPTDCDWEEAIGNTSGSNRGHVTWDQGFVKRKMDLTLEGNRLKVVTSSVYSDNRRPRTSTEHFIRKKFVYPAIFFTPTFTHLAPRANAGALALKGDKRKSKPAIARAKPQALASTKKKNILLKSTASALAQLSPIYTAQFTTGLSQKDRNKGAQGPSNNTIPILDGLTSDSAVLVLTDKILNVHKEVYIDKNPESGILYYLPHSYHLNWDANLGYDFKMLYAATTAEEDRARVLMALRIVAGVTSRDEALIRDLLTAYKARNPQFKFNRVRPLPIVNQHPEMSVSDELREFVEIPSDKIVATVISDALAEINVSWVTDEVTKENIKHVLSQGIDINGALTYTLESKEDEKVIRPVRISISDWRTFSPIQWKRSVGWDNRTPYPIRLNSLHALVIKENKPIIYTWHLGETEVPRTAKIEWDASEVPIWLDSHANRIWLDYSVQRNCAECNKQVTNDITFGVSSSSSRVNIVLKSLNSLEATGADELQVKLRSRYFSSTGDTMKTQPAKIIVEDRIEVNAGAVYLVNRQPGEELSDDPLFEYQLTLAMPDGTIHNTPTGTWIPSQSGRLLIGSKQVKDALGCLPGSDC